MPWPIVHLRRVWITFSVITASCQYTLLQPTTGEPSFIRLVRKRQAPEHVKTRIFFYIFCVAIIRAFLIVSWSSICRPHSWKAETLLQGSSLRLLDFLLRLRGFVTKSVRPIFTCLFSSGRHVTRTILARTIICLYSAQSNVRVLGVMHNVMQCKSTLLVALAIMLGNARLGN